MPPPNKLRPIHPAVDNTSELRCLLSTVVASQANITALAEKLAALEESHDALKTEHEALKADVAALKAAGNARVAESQRFFVTLDEVAIVLSHRLFRASREDDNGAELWNLCLRLQPARLRAVLEALAKAELVQPTPDQRVMLGLFM
ncbi:uncharacterized protein LOC62_06G008047 [Vanrija pseudolonga]|uniref:Uncharacterized protein n=1 Tax=Vanrija pseudolonga TaxID=143232 RepID=A0AAF0YD45_9TREE|nr:hypothetical protein LOC62_06G008047 [Vanrija pseudolonga]